VASAFFVSLATVALPGPITLVATRLALSRGIGAAVWFLAGVTALDVALFAALASGAGPVLRTIGALPLVEFAGGLALIWAGIGTLRNPQVRKPAGAPPDIERRSLAGDFALGLVIAGGNPQYWIWWVTAGLAFVEAARAHGAPGLLWMLASLVGGVVAWYLPLLWAVSHGSTLLSEKAERWVVRGMGAALVLLGVALAGAATWRFYLLHS
jgi:threonine/homoserine/homoserine lactone efflux protein